jgi:hypothetical protein
MENIRKIKLIIKKGSGDYTDRRETVPAVTHKQKKPLFKGEGERMLLII